MNKKLLLVLGLTFLSSCFGVEEVDFSDEKFPLLDHGEIKILQGKQYECTICCYTRILEEFYVTSCNHALCYVCKTEWKQPTCPTCKKENPAYRKIFGTEDEVARVSRHEEEYQKRLAEQREKDRYITKKRMMANFVGIIVISAAIQKYPQIIDYSLSLGSSLLRTGSSFIKNFLIF